MPRPPASGTRLGAPPPHRIPPHPTPSPAQQPAPPLSAGAAHPLAPSLLCHSQPTTPSKGQALYKRKTTRKQHPAPPAPTCMPMSCRRCRSRGLVSRWSSVSSNASPVEGSMKKAAESPTLAACRGAGKERGEEGGGERGGGKGRGKGKGNGEFVESREGGRGCQGLGVAGRGWQGDYGQRHASDGMHAARHAACSSSPHQPSPHPLGTHPPGGTRRPSRPATSAPRWRCTPPPH